MTNRIWKFFTSLKLTVWLLGLSMLLVFLGTIAQVHEGLWNAQTRWFRHLLVVREAGDPWWVPPIYPGGYLLGILLLLNLLAAHLKRFHFTWRQAGINLTHFGIILLLVGQLATDMMSRESIMSFREGETRSYSEGTREWELAFLRSVDGEKDEVVAIPHALLKDGAALSDPKLPFTVRVKTYWPNSEPAFRAPMQQNSPPMTENGLAKDWDFHAVPEAKGMDDRNNPTAVVELSGSKGEPLGTWVVPSWAGDPALVAGVKRAYTQSVGKDVAQTIADKLAVPQEVTANGQTWRMVMRMERYYKDFNVTLVKTRHDVYPGTVTRENPQGTPKDFRSRVRIDNPSTGEKREVEIYMNSPLRYQGLTFYQSSMGKDEVQRGTSGLQVVRNPSWLTPYAGCLIVAVGMCWQFFYHLSAFLRRRAPAAA
jgi:hypothetical protein